jgi:hypothetical protein
VSGENLHADTFGFLLIRALHPVPCSLDAFQYTQRLVSFMECCSAVIDIAAALPQLYESSEAYQSSTRLGVRARFLEQQTAMDVAVFRLIQSSLKCCQPASSQDLEGDHLEAAALLERLWALWVLLMVAALLRLDCCPYRLVSKPLCGPGEVIILLTCAAAMLQWPCPSGRATTLTTRPPTQWCCPEGRRSTCYRGSGVSKGGRAQAGLTHIQTRHTTFCSWINIMDEHGPCVHGVHTTWEREQQPC